MFLGNSVGEWVIDNKRIILNSRRAGNIFFSCNLIRNYPKYILPIGDLMI